MHNIEGGWSYAGNYLRSSRTDKTDKCASCCTLTVAVKLNRVSVRSSLLQAHGRTVKRSI